MIRTRSGCLVAFLWTFALLWNGILAVIVAVFLFRTGLHGMEQFAFLAFFGIFLAAGVYLLRMAIRATGSAARFRDAGVELRGGAVGGKVEGSVHVREAALIDGPLELELRCLRRYDTDTNDDLLWRARQQAGSGYPVAQGMTALPFSFDVPADCRPTSDIAPRIAWTLQVTDSRNRTIGFDVPVR